MLPIEVGQIVGIPDAEITTVVDVSAFLEQKRAAFLAHLSQYEPDSPFSTIAAQIFEATLGTERFILARGSAAASRSPEQSLFAGAGRRMTSASERDLGEPGGGSRGRGRAPALPYSAIC